MTPTVVSCYGTLVIFVSLKLQAWRTSLSNTVIFCQTDETSIYRSYLSPIFSPLWPYVCLSDPERLRVLSTHT